jgi:hypothetical protein
VEGLLNRIFGLGVFLIPIVALLVGGVISVLSMVHKHQERLAKIERGINPDGPWPQWPQQK